VRALAEGETEAGGDLFYAGCSPYFAAYFGGALTHLFYDQPIMVGGKPDFDRLIPDMMVKQLPEGLMALILLLALSPLLALLALAVRWKLGNPVLFAQDRPGLRGAPFKFYKFRTMSDARDAAGELLPDADRLTPFGRLMRKFSLDELPQFFNVIAGQMSIVGPRPHAAASRADELLFWDIDQRYWHRHSVKPGITGLAQVRGLRGTTVKRDDLEQRLYADLEYGANWSLLSDIRIVFQTFTVLLHRNAY